MGRYPAADDHDNPIDAVAVGAPGVLADEIGEQLAGWGLAVRLETRGRKTGKTVPVALGYLDDPDGSLLIAAGSPDADWARNLEADPRVRATVGDRAFDAIAEPLDAPAAAAAVTALILKYGTPAEGLGRGPAFRIRPVAASESD